MNLKHINPAYASAFELKSLLQHKIYSPVELTLFFLDRIQLIDPQLHAFIQITADDALQAAQNINDLNVSRPLLGIPVLLTDHFEMQGTATTFGSRIYQHQIASQDGAEARILKAAGAIILGKINVSEFLFYPTTENLLMPSSSNPWQLDCSPGVSAIAAAIAAGFAPIGLTADLHAGARQTSGLCGTFGLKPTRGRIPVVRRHLVPITEKNFYQKGPVTRYVADAALLLDTFLASNYVEALQQTLTSSLKIGWSADLNFVPIQNEINQGMQQAVYTLKQMGHQLTELSLPFGDETLLHYSHILAADRLLSFLSLQQKQPNYIELVTDYTREWIERGQHVTGTEYSLGLLHVEWLKESIDHLFKEYNLLITPLSCVTCLPIPLSNISFSTDVDPSLVFWAFTIPFSMSGHPAAAIPFGYHANGLPFGIQIIGPYDSEELLLRFADTLEKKLNWTDHHPALNFN